VVDGRVEGARREAIVVVDDLVEGDGAGVAKASFTME
jgi:hypothetical protein